jgi:hypothetical protein
MQAHRPRLRLSNSHLRGRLPVLAAAVAVLVVTGSAAGATRPEMVRVAWDGKTHGGVQFVPDGNVVWLLSGTLLGSNVWRIDANEPAPKRVPLPTMRDIVAGHGQLWAVKQRGLERPHLYYVDVRGGYRLSEKQLPTGCGRIGHGHVVFGGRLWFFCNFDQVVVFDPRQAAPIKRITVAGDLIEGAGALWRLDFRFVLRCVAGPCKGRAFPVGTTGAWDTTGEVGWIFRKSASPRSGLLTLVQFRQRAVYDGFSIQLPRGFSSVPDLRVVGDEIWVQNTPKFQIARYRINDPEAPPRFLALPGVSKSAESSSAPAVAAGRVWVSVREVNSFKVFRGTLPLDPLPLRQIREALRRELLRAPGRLGVGATTGPPIYVSCEASKKRFRNAATFTCDVRFKKTTRIFCAALVDGRVAVDRTHAACRR